MTDKEKQLYGRRILHFFTPVRFKDNIFKSEIDSNFRTIKKLIQDFLPMCHHYVLVPENNDIRWNDKNVTLLPYPYPMSAVANRTFFHTKEFNKLLDMKTMDIDFVFCHQPEVLLNILMALSEKRYGEIVSKFSFFHWIDCSASRGSPAIPHTFMRQMEAINLSDKVYVHTDVSLDYLETNFKKDISVKMNREYIEKKISYMPMSSNVDLSDFEKFDLPKNKKIILFNHRWNQSTGAMTFDEYTTDLSKEYLLWSTDENSPERFFVKPLSKRHYNYLIKNVYCGVCFVDGYATWNISVQDILLAKKPVLVYNHPIMKYILGENYPYYFKTKEEFLNLLKDLPEKFDWKLPKHDEIWKNTLIDDMISCIRNTRGIPKYSLEWMYCIKNGYKNKNLITNQVTPTIGLNSNNQYIRRFLLYNGISDNPNNRYTEYSIKKECEKEVNEFIKNVDFKFKPVTTTPVSSFTKMDSFFEVK